MDAFELLKRDHKKVSEIFEKLEPTTERGVKTREELFTRLKNELDVHARVEEQIFYPALKEAQETHDITLEAYEEHAIVKQLLAELERISRVGVTRILFVVPRHSAQGARRTREAGQAAPR